MKTADQVYRLRIFLFSFARLSKCRLSLEALVEILADRDSDLSDLDEESDFNEPSDPEESSKEEMSDENVEDSPDECEREESKMAAGWWVYKAPVGKGLRVKVMTSFVTAHTFCASRDGLRNLDFFRTVLNSGTLI